MSKCIRGCTEWPQASANSGQLRTPYLRQAGSPLIRLQSGSCSGDEGGSQIVLAPLNTDRPIRSAQSQMSRGLPLRIIREVRRARRG